MRGDYKYEMQMRAEELADEMGVDYYDLPQNKQYELYEQAREGWIEARLAQADLARKRVRENDHT